MRNYADVEPCIINTYKLNHQYQTYDYVNMLKPLYMKFNKHILSIWEALMLSNQIIDESDPDIHLPQLYHCFQTAENVRKLYPDEEVLHLVGLIHDLGKLMLLDGFGTLPQWSVVGDIYPVGCQFSDKIIFSEFFDYNPDKFTKFGIYEPNTGLDNLTMSWGHDEYLYQVLKNHAACTIPDKYLRVIRYHSFYSFHTANDYEYLADDKDLELKPLLNLFSKCDLYSKNDEDKLDIDNLKMYYDGLINKYCPGQLSW